VQEKLRGFFYLFLLLAGVWLCLVSTLHWPELLAGFLLSAVCAAILCESFSRLGFPPMTLTRLGVFLIYLLVLAKGIVKANVDVAYRVLHPRMPIRPGIVTIQTSLQQDLAKLMLANSITLTPGTFTVDIIGDKLLIHWIYVKADDLETSTREIGEKFERYLLKIFE
jgi:multicomponent Na+:H+ antiporter subunit E